MMHTPVIRIATEKDAQAISDLVIRTLEISNAQDYAPADIARTVSHFVPDDVAARLADKTTIVAIRNDTVVGTARLTTATNGGGFSLRTVFVCPQAHGQGIGRAMYDHLTCDVAPGTRIIVRSSLYAERFYARLGFRKLRDHWVGSEQTIEMVTHR